VALDTFRIIKKGETAMVKNKLPCFSCSYNKNGYCEKLIQVSSVGSPIERTIERIQEDYLSDGWNRTAELLDWGDKKLKDYNQKIRNEEFKKFKKLCPNISELISILKTEERKK
jgi:hypothetical protein